MRITFLLLLLLTTVINASPPKPESDSPLSDTLRVPYKMDLTIGLPDITSDDIKATLHYAKQLREKKRFIEAAKHLMQIRPLVTDTALVMPIRIQIINDYEQAKQYTKAADICYKTYTEYPLSEKASGLLYNAGWYYEKAEKYVKAIEVYRYLSQKFPTHWDGLNAAYSIGYCYEKMNQTENMIKAFDNFAKTFVTDRSKQLYALLRIGRTYLKQNKPDKASTHVSMAVMIFEEYHDKKSIADDLGAEIYYLAGEIQRLKQNNIPFSGKNKKEVQTNRRLKDQRVEKTLKYYISAIDLDIEEWAMKSSYSIALLIENYIDCSKKQSHFGKGDDLLASKIRALITLDGYYIKCQEKLQDIIEYPSKNRSPLKEYALAESLYVAMAIDRAANLSNIGSLYLTGHIYSDFTFREKKIYKNALKDEYYKYLEKALSVYQLTKEELPHLTDPKPYDLTFFEEKIQDIEQILKE